METHMTARLRLTKFEYAVIFLEQQGLCGCGCGEPLKEGFIDEEHTIPNEFKPGKSDSLWLRECHKKKTAKDKADIARAKRRSGGKGSQRAKRENKSYRPIPQPSKEQRQEQYRRARAWKAENVRKKT